MPKELRNPIPTGYLWLLYVQVRKPVPTKCSMVGQDARPTAREYCWVSQLPVQPNLRAAKCQHALGHLWWTLELMRHSKSRFIEDARRVGIGAVRKPHLSEAKVSIYFLEFTIMSEFLRTHSRQNCFRQFHSLNCLIQIRCGK